MKESPTPSAPIAGGDQMTTLTQLTSANMTPLADYTTERMNDNE